MGAVIARDDEVLGEGYHAAYGGDHAEVAALGACVADPIGATLYVTLEPCCHQGRTPPCTDAIVQAGIKRVVVASDDPTDKASGRGLGILRDEGIEVQVVDGEVSQAARLLNQPFRKHARTGRPHVLFKSAMSLDGKVATQTGDSKWISGEESRALVHRWRAQSDAVCIGIGTALADDPLLTARTPEITRQPARVVFDSEARLPPGQPARPHGPRRPPDRGDVARGRPLARRHAARGRRRVRRLLGRQRGGARDRRARQARRARHPEHAARRRAAARRLLPGRG